MAQIVPQQSFRCDISASAYAAFRNDSRSFTIIGDVKYHISGSFKARHVVGKSASFQVNEQPRPLNFSQGTLGNPGGPADVYSLNEQNDPLQESDSSQKEGRIEQIPIGIFALLVFALYVGSAPFGLWGLKLRDEKRVLLGSTIFGLAALCAAAGMGLIVAAVAGW